MRSRGSCLPSLAILSLFVPMLYSQTATPDANGVVTFKTNVRTVVVDVVVIGDKGEPVKGLTRDAFQILESGKPQAVTFFDEHTLTPSTQEAGPALPPNVFTNMPSFKPTDSVNVLLLDSLNTPVEDQSYVHTQTMKFLAGMPPGTRVAVFSLSTQLRFVHGFTADASELKAAINDPKLGGGPQRSGLLRTNTEAYADQTSIRQVQEYQAKTAVGGHGPSPELAGTISSLQDFQNQSVGFQNELRMHVTLDALRQLGGYLAGIPGRKNLIWFVGNIPLNIFPQGSISGTPAQPNTATSDPFAQDRNYGSEIQKTSNLLAAAQVAIYPVSAKGVQVGQALEAAALGNGLAPMGPTTGAIPTTDLQSEATERNGTYTAMEQVAHDTGGVAFHNNDFSAAVAKAIDNGSHYYTLAYTPPDKDMDGRFRKIDVKVTPGNYRLAYRRGYYAQAPLNAKDAAKRITDPLHPYMGRGMPDTTQIPYTIRLVPSTSQQLEKADRSLENPQIKGPVTRYAITYTIPVEGLDLQVKPDGTRHASLEVTMLAYDYNGKALNWTVRAVELDLKPDRWQIYQQMGVAFRLEFDIPNGEIYLRTGIYDNVTTKVGTIEIPMASVVASK
jgi:VWFA-related protein